MQRLGRFLRSSSLNQTLTFEISHINFSYIFKGVRSWKMKVNSILYIYLCILRSWFTQKKQKVNKVLPCPTLTLGIKSNHMSSRQLLDSWYTFVIYLKHSSLILNFKVYYSGQFSKQGQLVRSTNKPFSCICVMKCITKIFHSTYFVCK